MTETQTPLHLSGDRIVRVYVSATFRDMRAEREHLVTVVFPELRERIEKLGLELFEVDLHCAPSEENADGERANSWAFCKQWIDRADPFLIGVLGQRYGWVPEPSEIKEEDDRARYAGCSITEMEIRHAVLDGALKRHSFFYFRDCPVPSTVPDDFYTEFVDVATEKKLGALKDVIRNESGRPVRDYPCGWTGSGFAAMEEFGRLVLEDLWSGVLRDERYVGKDLWRRALEIEPETDPRYIDDSQPIPRDLWENILTVATAEPKGLPDAECDRMDAFATARLRWFQGRKLEIELLADFISLADNNLPRLAIVTAAPGQGKSTLLAHLHQQLKSSPHLVITHFVGATERPATARAVVERLLAEMDRIGANWPAEQQDGIDQNRDFNSLRSRLAQRLGDYAGEPQIVILLDALNQLSDGHDLQWLPTRLGPSVRVIVSCVDDPAATDDGPERIVRAALAARASGALNLTLGELDSEDLRKIVESYLREYCVELDARHVSAICAMPLVHNPLYLLVMLDELRGMIGGGINDAAPNFIATMAADNPSTVSLFRRVLQRLEAFNEIAPNAVQWWCLYLAYGRAGMTSNELVGLLARRLGPDGPATSLQIERALRPYLMRRGAQLDFFHAQLKQAVLEQYGERTEPAKVHSDIAAYFRDVADRDGKMYWQESARLLGELPFHLAQAARDKELREIFSQLAFLAARVCVGQVYEQIADFHLAGSPLPRAVVPWMDFLYKHVHRLSCHPDMLVALVNHEGFPDARAQALSHVWPRPWLRTSAEPMPASESVEAEKLHVEVTGSIDFPWGRVSAIASRRSVVFSLERLGAVRVFDLAAMRETDSVLSIRRDRPVVLACAPDASSLSVFYETGKAELYRCIRGDYGWPAGLDLAAEFDFQLPETEDPIVSWHEDKYWYQASAGTLASVSLESPRPLLDPLPIGHQGELSALVFSEDVRLAALRQGADSVLFIEGAPPVRRQSAHVTAACACGEFKAAVAFTDGVVVEYELGDVITVKSEVRAGILCGAMGWDGSRMLWMTTSGGLCAWRPEDSALVPVLDDQRALISQPYAVPRQWHMLGDDSMLLGTTHSAVAVTIMQGGAAKDGGLCGLFGGSTWRVVRRREEDMWLSEKGRSHEMLLQRAVTGAFHCAPDGKGHFFTARGNGPGLLVDVARVHSTALQGCPHGIDLAVGDDAGGCWFADRSGEIYFASTTGQCNCAGRIPLSDVHSSHLENCGDHLVWAGHSRKSFRETGAEPARTFVFFSKEQGNPVKLDLLEEQSRNPKEGSCLAVHYDRVSKKLVTLWVKSTDGQDSYSLRVGPVKEFARWQFKEIDIVGLGEIAYVGSGLSANGRFLGIVNTAGEMCCLSVTTGNLVATLASGAPFTAVAPGAAGPEFWLGGAHASVYRCALAEGSA
jgi:hypothetical protein